MYVADDLAAERVYELVEECGEQAAAAARVRDPGWGFSAVEGAGFGVRVYGRKPLFGGGVSGVLGVSAWCNGPPGHSMGKTNWGTLWVYVLG